MPDTAPFSQDLWLSQNQRYLMACIASVRYALQSSSSGPADQDPAPADAHHAVEAEILASRAALSAPAALDVLAERLALSPFERDTLLACAGLELDGSLAAAYEADGTTALCFARLMTSLPSAHWTALTPTAPLRRYGLITLGVGRGLMHAPLRIEERVLHYLTGVQFIEPRLRGILCPVPPPPALPPSQRLLAEQIARRLQQPDHPAPAVTYFCGEHLPTLLEIAAQAVDSVARTLFKLHSEDIPDHGDERASLARLCERECVLHGAVLAIVSSPFAEEQRRQTAQQFYAGNETPTLVLTREAPRESDAKVVWLRDKTPPLQEQRLLWFEAMGDLAPRCSETINQILGHFAQSSIAIRTIARSVREELATNPSTDPASLLWNASRQYARPRLADLCQRIEPEASWDDLILPTSQISTLHAIAGQVRQRLKVYHRWGFARGSQRGRGISVLFAGLSGTGKTLAAEVLANDLRLDLYRIDLSQLVSKYIGETEKNLRRVFDAAEECGAVLLFDEADALFGKRSEVKDSHDRYANIEVSYLLQRMEAYRGLAILTSNIKSALDTAFLRRIRFVVQFPFPNAEQREKLWRLALSPDAPQDGVEPMKLSRLNVAGGSIRNIAMNAAFLAADAGEPLRMTHMLEAARGEYQKLEKPLTDGEIQGWV